MSKAHRIGVRAEERVVRDLQKHGAEVEQSPGSRGAADIKAEFPTGRKWYVQVKGTGDGSPQWPSSEELRRLKIAASRAGATPVVALVHEDEKVTYRSARNGRQLRL